MNTSFLPILRNTLAVLSFLTLMIAFLGSIGNIQRNFPEGEKHIAFILDVSKSMQVRDTGEKSRLNAAKKYIQDTMQSAGGYEFSLNIFAGESLRILPFTSDISLFETFLSSLDNRNITKQGTRIDLAFADALASFDTQKTGDIVLLTDGDENAITIPPALIQKLHDQGINITIIGVGTTTGGYIPEDSIFSPYKLYQGQPVIAKLNEGELKKLATTLGANYKHIGEKLYFDQEISHAQTSSKYLYLAVLLWILFLGTHMVELYFPKR